MLPDSVLSSTTLSGSFLFPRNRRRSALVDYEYGGVNLNDPSQGLKVKTWRCIYEDGNFILSAAGVQPTTVYSRPGVTELSFTFDQNMNPFLAFTDSYGSFYYWYDTLSATYVLSQLPQGSISPRCCLDDKRDMQSAVSDIILAYTRGDSLYVRVQRDRYETEYELTSALPKTGVLDQIGMNEVWRFQFGFREGERITPEAVPLILQGVLPDSMADEEYSASLQGFGGVIPYTFSVSAGSLPPGLTLDSSTGLISGTPTTPDDYTFTIKLEDNDGTVVTREYTITIIEALSLSGVLANAIEGKVYSSSLTATGGIAPYTWSISAGSLPDGLTLNSSTGEISGIPTVVDEFSFTVRITDSQGNFVDSEQSISVTEAVDDPYFDNVVALLHFNGVDGSQAVIDETGRYWTVYQDAQLDTAQSVFGGSSLLLTNTGVTRVASASSSDFQYGTGDFTIEFWFRTTTVSPSFQILWDQRTTVGAELVPTIYLAGSSLRYRVAGSDIITGPTVSVDTWYHVAVCRAGGFTRLFVNGVQQGGTVSDGFNYAISPAHIGAAGHSPNDAQLIGWIDEVRVTKGVARYTANFSVPDTQFPPEEEATPDPYFANVTSLIHFDGTNGSTTFTDQIPGRTWSIGSGSPILNTTTPKFGTASLKNTGSSYVDSNSDDGLAFGTGDFTVEGWFRPVSTGTLMWFDMRTALSQPRVCLYTASGALNYYVNGAVRITGAYNITTTNWHHIAVSRVSGQTRVFVNGTQVGSTWADTTDYTAGRIRFGTAGDTPGFGSHAGYTDSFRVTKGVGRYTANFVPPQRAFPNS